MITESAYLVLVVLRVAEVGCLHAHELGQRDLGRQEDPCVLEVVLASLDRAHNNVCQNVEGQVGEKRQSIHVGHSSVEEGLAQDHLKYELD